MSMEPETWLDERGNAPTLLWRVVVAEHWMKGIATDQVSRGRDEPS